MNGQTRFSVNTSDYVVFKNSFHKNFISAVVNIRYIKRKYFNIENSMAMSVKTTPASTSTSQNTHTSTNTTTNSQNHQPYLKCGYLRKQKTMKKKFFVLKPETPDSLARLEYYDDEKKWRKNQQPKRTIILKTCFNINKHKRQDIKQKHVIDLYTKDDCFSIVFDSEEELEEWLRPMLFLQHGEELWDGDPPKPVFEHVWSVDVMDRGLGSQSKIRGAYRLCLTDKKLSLVPNGNSKLNVLEFSLIEIRRCGATDNFLYIEVGRSSVTGEGDIYMATTDSVIACNMRDIILQAMSNSKKDKKDDLAPKPRMRSSSATESTKSVTMNTARRHKPIESPGNVYSDRTPLPPLAAPSAAIVQWCALQRAAAQRRHSVSAVVGNTCGSHNTAPPVHLHHQRTHSLPVSPADTNSHILNENNNYAPMGNNGAQTSLTTINTTTSTTTSHIASSVDQVDCYISRRGSIGNRNTTSSTNSKRHNRSLAISGTGVISITGRERCDSLPTRARTTSEGQTANRNVAHLMRPRSMYAHDGPASPPSNCSTDSAGSSLSIDETDWVDGPTNDCIASRYGHSLTPDEHVIFEENDEWDRPSSMPKNSPNVSSGIHSESPSGASCGSSPLDVNDGYVPMYPCDTGYVAMQPLSPAASSCSVTSGTPSTDLRFSEYHLDKVPSYILPSDNNEDSGRPIRTYSVGSKPQHGEQSQIHESTRVRAFSVGSHAKGGVRRNLKASSDPAALPAGSPMGDLMELDFTHNNSSSSHSTPTSNAGYVEMRPLSQSSNNAYMDMRPGSSSKDERPYVDMSGSLGASPNKPLSSSINNNCSPYVDMSGKSASPKQDDYMMINMSWRNDVRPTRSTPDGYLEMSYKPQRKPTLSQSSNTSDDYLNMSGNNGKNNGSSSNSSSSSAKKKEYHRREKNRSKPIAIQQNISSPPKNGPPTYLPLQSANNSSSSPGISSPFSTLQRNKNRKNIETTPTGQMFPISLSGNSFQTSESSRKCPVDATSGTIKIYGTGTTGMEDYAPMSGNNLIESNKNSSRISNVVSTNEDDYTEIDFETCKKASFPLKDTSEYVNYNPTARSLPITRSSSSLDDFGEYAIMKPVHANNRRTTPFRKTSMPIFSAASTQTRPNIVKQSTQQPFKTTNISQQVQIVKPGVNMTNHPQSSFKPITANLPKVDNDDKKCKSASPKTVDNLLTRQLSNTSDIQRLDQSSECLPLHNCVSGSETIETSPRPNSVNSDTVSSSVATIRPASVNSEKVSTTRPSSVSSEGSLSRSRPSSSSSDLNSSSSTLVGSRPPSVSSERELHYITLEHECEMAAGGTRSPRNFNKPQPTSSTANITTTEPCNNCTISASGNNNSTNSTSRAITDPKFAYTAIDFIATDGLKQNTNVPLKH